MKIFVTGPDGNVGRVLQRKGALPLRVDITNRRKVKYALKSAKPDLLIHCAAMTDVDLCEIQTKQARDVNLWGTANLRMEYDGPMVFISSDHVFNGRKGPYDEKAKASPKNVYGMTKMGAEAAMWANDHPDDKIVRTSTLFGGRNDRKFWSLYNDLKNGNSVEVSALIFRSFMYVEHFADWVLALPAILSDSPRIINISGRETVNYGIFARKLAEVFQFDQKLIAVRSEEMKGKTPRPYRGGLVVDRARSLGLFVQDYEEGLRALKQEMDHVKQEISGV